MSPKKRDTSAPASPSASPTKRKLGAVVSDYDTRHKRARKSDPGLQPRTTRSVVTTTTPSTSGQAAPKRRGRTPNNAPKPASKSVATPSAPFSARREFFDGVVLNVRSVPASKGKEKAEYADEDLGEEDADGDREMPDEELDFVSRIESSLAGSNKENESIDMDTTYRNGAESEDDDAGNNPSTRVLENPIQTAAHKETIGAAGDVAELQDAEEGPEHLETIRVKEVNHVTLEDVSQFLAAVADGRPPANS
ncbi:hypothetical protein DXG03_007791 [Asterophora parasitica]|uniref:Uncharacterized protein n=1 Tax=Asterophora parasitica TaxID=117018 RepID=A0A9P7GC67_9AGAR|nr:hypothetical protein DXG03_007791 [Asterophora parasitica]